MFYVNSCCCVYSLRTGNLILFTMSMVVALSHFLYYTITGFSSKEISEFLMTLTHILHAVLLISVSAAGIYGVLKRRPLFLIPYLGWQLFFSVVGIITIIVLPFDAIEILRIDKSTPPDPGVIVTAEFALITIEVIHHYFFSIVLSHYKELKRDTETENLVDN